MFDFFFSCSHWFSIDDTTHVLLDTPLLAAQRSKKQRFTHATTQPELGSLSDN